MHTLDEKSGWNPFPPTQATVDAEHRVAANRAIGVSAIGLAVTGALELTIAVLSGSVGLLGDALHNLSDVSTSLVVFVGFRFSRRPATPDHTYGSALSATRWWRARRWLARIAGTLVIGMVLPGLPVATGRGRRKQRPEP